MSTNYLSDGEWSSDDKIIWKKSNAKSNFVGRRSQRKAAEPIADVIDYPETSDCLMGRTNDADKAPTDTPSRTVVKCELNTKPTESARDDALSSNCRVGKINYANNAPMVTLSGIAGKCERTIKPIVGAIDYAVISDCRESRAEDADRASMDTHCRTVLQHRQLHRLVHYNFTYCLCSMYRSTAERTVHFHRQELSVMELRFWSFLFAEYSSPTSVGCDARRMKENGVLTRENLISTELRFFKFYR